MAVEEIRLCDVVLCFEEATESVEHYRFCAAHAALYPKWLADPGGVRQAIREALRGR